MNKFTLITGASRGIGKEMAIELAKQGDSLILVARSQNELTTLADELRHLYKIEVITIPLDLIKPNSVLELVNECIQKDYPINRLINNAGIGCWGAFTTLTSEEQIRSIELNITSVVKLTHAFIPLLKKQPTREILNVASIGGMMPLPYFSVYGATKAFVILFSRGLREELKKEKFSVTCLCPGPTDSDFFNAAGMQNLRWNKKAFLMSANTVAKKGLVALKKNKAIVIPGLANKLTALLAKIIPHTLFEKVVGWIYLP